MSTTTPIAGLTKPDGLDAFARSVLNANSDKIDKQFLVLGLMAAYYGTLTKGAVVFSGGNPSSQSISGPGGITGSMTWSGWGTNTITETLSITAPFALSITKTYNLTNLSETWAVS
jgi:hypothetical protein